jgi:hypothetical protein
MFLSHIEDSGKNMKVEGGLLERRRGLWEMLVSI